MRPILLAILALTLAVGTAGIVAGTTASAAHKTHQSTKTGTTKAGTATYTAQIVAYVASVVGVSPDVLKQDLNKGQTLLQIAGSKYSSADALATALLAPVKTQMDKAAGTGAITAGQEAMGYSFLHGAVVKLVTTPHPLQQIKTVLSMARTFANGLATAMATACNTTSTALKAALKAGGRTPLAICQATNSSATADSLVAALMGPFKSAITLAVATGQLTADQASAALPFIQGKIAAWVVTPLKAHSH